MNKLSISSLVSLAVAAPLTLTSSVFAFEREHEAHEHGHAELMVVQEKNELQMQLRSPAMNIVGFEHAPSSKSDHQKIDQAKALFETPAKLFTLNSAAGCELEHVEIVSALLETDEHDHHDKHDDHDDEHHEHHDEHGQDDHDEEEHGHDHDGETHSEFDVAYHFECQDLARLEGVDIKLFEVFPAMEEIEAQVITSKGQKLVELNAKQRFLAF